MMTTLRHALIALTAALLASIAPAAIATAGLRREASAADPPDAWRREGATHRYLVTVTTPRLDSSLDVASLVVDTMGRGAPQGADLAMYDARGRRMKLNVKRSFGGDDRLYRIEFQVPKDAAEPFCLYVGGGRADPAPFRPNYGGLTLSVGPIPKGNPNESYERLKKSLDDFSVRRTGPRPNIDDLENPLPFRESPDPPERGRRGRRSFRRRYTSDNMRYMGVYRGTLFVPESGEWTIATNCDDASFVVIDGQYVVGRPGKGLKDGNEHRPMLNAWKTRKSVTLERGVHELTYYHIQFDRKMLARLGWKAPGDDEFRVVPAKAFARTLGARVTRVENGRREPVPYFESVTLPTWLFGGDVPVYRERFEACAPEAFKDFTWRFADDTTADGPSVVKHFLHTRKDRPWDVRTVTLEVPGRPPCARRVLLEPSDPDDLERRYVELDPIAERYVAFRGEPLSLVVRLRNVTEPIELDLTARLVTGDNPPVELLSRRLAMQEDQLEILPLEVSVDRIREVPWADVDIEVATGGIVIARRRILLRTARRLPEGLTVRDGTPRVGGDPVVFVEVGLPAQKKLELDSVRRVLTVGDLLGTGEDAVEDVAEGMNELLEDSVPVKALEGTSRTVMEAIPHVLRAKVDEDDLAIVSYGLADMQMGTPHADFERRLSFVVDSLMKRGAAVVLVTPPPRGADRHEAYRYAVATKRVALKRGVPVVDFFSYLRLRRDGRTLFDDPVARRFYPSAAGRKLLVEFLVDRLEE